MADYAIEVVDVWKKFHRGEVHDSLRDLVPSMAKHFFGMAPKPMQLQQGDFWALREIDFRKIGRGTAGPVTLKLQKVFHAAVKGEHPRSTEWCTWVREEAALPAPARFVRGRHR